MLAVVIAAGSGFFYGKHVESAERDADLLQDAQVAHDLYVEETKKAQRLGKRLTEAQNANAALASQLAEAFNQAGSAPIAAGDCINDEQLRVINDALRGAPRDGAVKRP
ncbi:MAG TPA: hypothetical protein VD931_22735 [Baekduia sp.]|nr:hypothetical protein [Baekduia sp.]